MVGWGWEVTGEGGGSVMGVVGCAVGVKAEMFLRTGPQLPAPLRMQHGSSAVLAVATLSMLQQQQHAFRHDDPTKWTLRLMLVCSACRDDRSRTSPGEPKCRGGAALRLVILLAQLVSFELY